MNKDQLLGELGDLARREGEAGQARLDERWDRLAAGTLTAEEEAELKALAASSPEAQEAYEAFRPLGADFQAGVVAKISQELRPRVLFFRRVIRRAEVWVGLAAAVAAGVFLLLRTPPLTSGYEATLSGGFNPSRGGGAATANGRAVFTPGSPFILEVSPKRPLDSPGKVKARVFLSSSSGREDLRSLDGLESKLEPSETGSVRLDVSMGQDIKAPPGDWILWIAVARSGVPDAKEVQARLRAGGSRSGSWQALCEALQKEDKPPPAPAQLACAGFRVETQPGP
ncbi:MAG: hypothetical protein ACJ76N_06815 [Thermoanaerobaculia bacterium]